jgi:hypothetical protein
VRDNKAGLSRHQLAHGVLDLQLGARVDVGGRLVEDKHLCVQQHGARNGKQLLLPAGDVDAIVAQNRIVAVGHAERSCAFSSAVTNPITSSSVASFFP